VVVKENHSTGNPNQTRAFIFPPEGDGLPFRPIVFLKIRFKCCKIPLPMIQKKAQLLSCS